VSEKVLFCWSGGKDSAMALHRVLADSRYEVVGLLTTYNEHYQRVSMHGIRLDLSERQAESIGLPLDKVFVSQRSSNEEYALKMAECMLRYKEQGVTTVAYGDIFLEDLRAWREENLRQIGMSAIFPLWKNDTRELIREFIDLGFKSRICCINDAFLDESAVGRDIDAEFIASLPPDVDPCGENGEYHSFAYGGPIFRETLAIECGEKVYRPVERTHPGSDVCALPDRKLTKGFWFCDLLLAESAALSP
jgi:uncharacterized protein (TIGR00290 family)